VWAPTAQALNLQLFNHAIDTTPSTVMTMQANTGTWSACVDDSWNGKYYLFGVRVYVPGQRAILETFVTDPYSVDLALNGVKSRLTDLHDPDTQPDSWDHSGALPLASVE
jgi:pullulanase